MPKSRSSKKRASFAEAVLRGKPYNRQTLKFLMLKKYGPENERAAQLILEGLEQEMYWNWRTATKLVCNTTVARARAGSLPLEMGVWASMVLAEMHSRTFRPIRAPTGPAPNAPTGPAPDGAPNGAAPTEANPNGAAPNGAAPNGAAPAGDAPSAPAGDAPAGDAGVTTPPRPSRPLQTPGAPPRLVRQCAYNPELCTLRLAADCTEEPLWSDLDLFKTLGYADLDCDAKWSLTLQQLSERQDIALPGLDSSHYHSTRAWFRDNALRTLAQLKHYPVRFPVALFKHPHRALSLQQAPVRLNAPI